MLTTVFKVHALAFALAFNSPAPEADRFDFEPWKGDQLKAERLVIVKPADIGTSDYRASLADGCNREAALTLKQVYNRKIEVARFLVGLDKAETHTADFSGIREELANTWRKQLDDKIQRQDMTPDELASCSATLLSQIKELYESTKKMMEHGKLDPAEKQSAKIMNEQLWEMKERLRYSIELVTKPDIEDIRFNAPSPG